MSKLDVNQTEDGGRGQSRMEVKVNVKVRRKSKMADLNIRMFDNGYSNVKCQNDIYAECQTARHLNDES